MMAKLVIFMVVIAIAAVRNTTTATALPEIPTERASVRPLSRHILRLRHLWRLDTANGGKRGWEFVQDAMFFGLREDVAGLVTAGDGPLLMGGKVDLRDWGDDLGYLQEVLWLPDLTLRFPKSLSRHRDNEA